MGQFQPSEKCGWIDKVVEEVADREGVDFLELPPIYETVDPDAVTALCKTQNGSHVTVEFTYLDYRITISEATDVSISESVE
ncbi:HalOD1 output domain-containing protein [Salinibaculum salinum]|uniref:HalOD1 output domain-containing protein n=1 Tax=Salinibaculum salinum TaxID=3131996 RepID=UPI0030EBCD54